MADSDAGSEQTIKVFIRVRPLVSREDGTNIVVFPKGDDEIHVEDHAHNVSCKYSHVFDMHASQAQVYEHVRDTALHAVSGFNSTLFAYGQTSSGKTFTLFGPEGDPSLFDSGPVPKLAGVIPRAVRELFDLIHKKSDHVQFTVYCSFLQIYNEQIYDALLDKDGLFPLSVHETPDEGIYVEGLSEFLVTCPGDCLDIIAKGEANRAVRGTHMNEYSSRSHSIFQLHIEQQAAGSPQVQRSKLNLVDLAGSEKWNTSVNMGAEHISELTNINLSLLTLSRCISALASKTPQHIPFRESKLTRLLRDSLGGNSITRVIATLSPSQVNIEESVATLKFADSAGRVMNHARVNASLLPDRLRVRQLEQEVTRLRSLLADQGGRGAGDASGEGGGGMHEKLLMLAEENRNMQQHNYHLMSALQKAGMTEIQTARSRTGSVSGPSASIAVGQATVPAFAMGLASAAVNPHLEAELEREKELNKAMGETLDTVRSLTAKFFELEIEEDDLRQGVTRAWDEFKVREETTRAKPLPKPVVPAVPYVSPAMLGTAAMPGNSAALVAHADVGSPPRRGSTRLVKSPITSPIVRGQRSQPQPEPAVKKSRSESPVWKAPPKLPVMPGSRGSGAGSMSDAATRPKGSTPVMPALQSSPQVEAQLFRNSTRRTDFLRGLASTDQAATPIQPASPGFGRPPRRMVGNAGGILSSSASMGTMPQVDGPPSMSFRVRGKKGAAASPLAQTLQQQASQRPMSEESRLIREIAAAKKQMEEQAKMQAFFEAKARKHRERADMVEKIEKAQKQEQERREKARRKRAAEVKAKLEAMRKEQEAAREADKTALSKRKGKKGKKGKKGGKGKTGKPRTTSRKSRRRSSSAADSTSSVGSRQKTAGSTTSAAVGLIPSRPPSEVREAPPAGAQPQDPYSKYMSSAAEAPSPAPYKPSAEALQSLARMEAANRGIPAQSTAPKSFSETYGPAMTTNPNITYADDFGYAPPPPSSFIREIDGFGGRSDASKYQAPPQQPAASAYEAGTPFTTTAATPGFGNEAVGTNPWFAGAGAATDASTSKFGGAAMLADAYGDSFTPYTTPGATTPGFQ